MTDAIVYTRIHRPPADLVARAAVRAMSDLYECFGPGRDACLMGRDMSPLSLKVRATGPAVTARCAAGDNLMMHKALLIAEPGDVLVVQSEDASAAQWGDLAARYAARKGLAGVIVDGPIRDAPILLADAYPVWCTSISPAHPSKCTGGVVNAPIRCGGIDVRPGDIVSADLDGVLVIPRERLADVVAEAERRARHETEILAAIDRGVSLFELHKLAPAYAALSVREIEGTWDRDDRGSMPTSGSGDPSTGRPREC